MPDLIWQGRTVQELTLIGVCDGQSVVNVHHFEATSTKQATLPDDAAMAASSAELADHWVTTLKTPWLACHTLDYTLQTVKCQVVEAFHLWRHKLTATERPLSTANVGTAAGSSDVLQGAGIIRWRTPQAGKSHRGRTYVGPLMASWVSSGLLTSTAVTAIQAYGTAMVNAYGAGTPVGTNADWRLTIYSRPYNMGEYQYTSRKTGTLTVVTPPDYAGQSTNVTVASTDNVLRTQRRREIGVGS